MLVALVVVGLWGTGFVVLTTPLVVVLLYISVYSIPAPLPPIPPSVLVLSRFISPLLLLLLRIPEVVAAGFTPSTTTVSSGKALISTKPVSTKLDS